MKIVLIMAAFVVSSASFASGTVTVRGKLRSITKTQYVVETAKSTYYLERSAVPAREAEKLERTEVPVTFTVPFAAVDKVKSRRGLASRR